MSDLSIGIGLGLAFSAFALFVYIQTRMSSQERTINADQEKIDEAKIKTLVDSESRDERLKYLASTDDPAEPKK